MPTLHPMTADQKADECLKFIEAICSSLPPNPSKEEKLSAALCGALCVAVYFAMPELTGRLREAGARISFDRDGVSIHSPTVIRPAPFRGPGI